MFLSTVSSGIKQLVSGRNVAVGQQRRCIGGKGDGNSKDPRHIRAHSCKEVAMKNPGAEESTLIFFQEPQNSKQLPCWPATCSCWREHGKPKLRSPASGQQGALCPWLVEGRSGGGGFSPLQVNETFE